MKKIIILGLLFLLMFNLVLAETEDLSNEDALNQAALIELENNFKEIAGQELPGFMQVLFGEERINLHFVLNNGNKVVLGLVTEAGKFKEMSKKPLTNPTVNVYLTEKVITEIEKSENPLVTFRKALDEEKITYQAVGLGKKIKFGIINFGLRIGSWFS